MGSFTLSAIIIRIMAIKATEYLSKKVFLLAELMLCDIATSGYYFCDTAPLITAWESIDWSIESAQTFPENICKIHFLFSVHVI